MLGDLWNLSRDANGNVVTAHLVIVTRTAVRIVALVALAPTTLALVAWLLLRH